MRTMYWKLKSKKPAIVSQASSINIDDRCKIGELSKLDISFVVISENNQVFSMTLNADGARAMANRLNELADRIDAHNLKK